MNIKDEFLRIVDALTAAEIQYVVVGGLAVAIHGCPRLTIDIDILIRAADLDRAKDVTMKRRAGRPKDLADIAALESELPSP